MGYLRRRIIVFPPGNVVCFPRIRPMWWGNPFTEGQPVAPCLVASGNFGTFCRKVMRGPVALMFCGRSSSRLWKPRGDTEARFSSSPFALSFLGVLLKKPSVCVVLRLRTCIGALYTASFNVSLGGGKESLKISNVPLLLLPTG